MATPPREVAELLARREAARRARDFAVADAVRDELRALGWLVRDTPAGPELAAAPPYQPTDPRGLRPRWGEPDQHEVTLVVHVTGWPGDVERAVAALAAHHRHVDHEVLLLDDGADEATGRALERLAGTPPGGAEGQGPSPVTPAPAGAGRRAVPPIRVLHFDPAVGFGRAMNLGMGQATGRVLVWLDPHVEATGDLLSPLLGALAAPGVGLAGGWGVVTRSMLDFEAAEGPEVDAVEGYLLAVPRALAARAEVDPRARYYRNADLGWSFAVRDLGGARPLAAVRVAVPARRHRHRGYHDTDPLERDRASKKNYDRFLARWKRRTDLLTQGFTGYHRHDPGL